MNSSSKWLVYFKKVLAPFKIKKVREHLGPLREAPLHVLDVGCGNGSCEITRRWLKVAEYHGVDREYWQGSQDDYKKMDRLFFLDLDSSNLAEIPNAHYDLIIFSHVIEHLQNGEAVLQKLSKKLKPGGLFYVETPSPRTLRFPSAIGFLNFFDDPTHVRVYPIPQVFQKPSEIQELQMIQFGLRRDWARVLLLSPVAIALNLFYFLPFRRKLFSTGLWDLLGVASFACLKRQNVSCNGLDS